MPKRFNGCEHTVADCHIIAWWKDGDMTPTDLKTDIEAAVDGIEGDDHTPMDVAEKIAMALNCSQVSVRETGTGRLGIFIA